MNNKKRQVWSAAAVSVLAGAGLLAACGGSGTNHVAAASATQQPTTPNPAPAAPTPTGMTMALIGEYVDGTVAAAEITAYDPDSKRLFVVNGALGSVDVLDLANPAAPRKISTISKSSMNGDVNSVAIHNGIVALAVAAPVKTSPGTVMFYRASDLTMVSSVTVGALPDMLTFTADGKYVLVANEGEPNSYGQADSIDPEGSIAVIDVRNIAAPTARLAGFASFNSQLASLRTDGVRIFGPGATVAQDLEPEYIAVSDDSKTAYVTLQENNALAVVDIETATVKSIKPLGYKDHSVAGMGLDASDEDGGVDTNSGTPSIKIAPQPVKGMYMPDAIAHFVANGTSYLITANEGDAREYVGFAEEVRVREHCGANGLDPSVFGSAGNLTLDSNLGRLRITNTPNGGSDGKNSSGRCTGLYAFGGRSFSIWTPSGTLVYDSGDQFEQRTRALGNVAFNASNDNNNPDSRSPSKGPEPEGVTVAKFGSKTYAFIGLERTGGVIVYDISSPSTPSFVTYINSRSGQTGHRGPEGLTVVAADKSPNGKPLLIVGNEVSGSTAIYQINLQY